MKPILTILIGHPALIGIRLMALLAIFFAGSETPRHASRNSAAFSRPTPEWLPGLPKREAVGVAA